MYNMNDALGHLDRCIANYEYDKGQPDPTPYAKEQKITFLLKTLEYQRQLNTLYERAVALLNEEYGSTDILQILLKAAIQKPKETNQENNIPVPETINPQMLSLDQAFIDQTITRFHECLSTIEENVRRSKDYKLIAERMSSELFDAAKKFNEGDKKALERLPWASEKADLDRGLFLITDGLNIINSMIEKSKKQYYES